MTGNLTQGLAHAAEVEICKPVSITRPTRLRGLRINGTLFSIWDCPQPVWGNPLADEEGFYAFSAARAKREIIFAGPALIGVTFNNRRRIVIDFKPIDRGKFRYSGSF